MARMRKPAVKYGWALGGTRSAGTKFVRRSKPITFVFQRTRQCLGEVRKNEDLPCSAPGFRLTVGMIQGRDLLRKVYRLSPNPPSLRCPHQAYLVGVYEHWIVTCFGRASCWLCYFDQGQLDNGRCKKVRRFVMSHCRLAVHTCFSVPSSPPSTQPSSC